MANQATGSAANTPRTGQLNNQARHALVETARAKTLRALVKVELFLDRELPTPQVTFNLRGKTAGIFQYNTCRTGRTKLIDERSLLIRLNQALLLTHPRQFIDEVIPHEICHLAVACHYGAKPRPHGKEWQNLMQNCFGLPANIYHNFPVAQARTHPRPYAYQCNCGIHYFTARRHNNRLRGSQYSCHNCGGLLHYIGKLTATR